ncbi:hypothetical protein CMI47_18260 [Candidatus Pacearchaeota archaeon]|jgi:predicted transcriptional regulator|nr:hypothetical protein [Candidatus Pacearchaeota archaeon]|tara:strand:- start:10347 stop:10598 length:252 start_codon:yes stop_codon:yes gene_type:complete
MNWYKKQLDKIANSCLSNTSDDLFRLSEILENDFNIFLSKNEIKDVLTKSAFSAEDAALKISQELSGNDRTKLIALLNRYSQL